MPSNSQLNLPSVTSALLEKDPIKEMCAEERTAYCLHRLSLYQNNHPSRIAADLGISQRMFSDFINSPLRLIKDVPRPKDSAAVIKKVVDDKDRVIKLLSELSVRKVAKKYNVSTTVILKIIKNSNVVLRELKEKRPKKTSVNEQTFHRTKLRYSRLGIGFDLTKEEYLSLKERAKPGHSLNRVNIEQPLSVSNVFVGTRSELIAHRRKLGLCMLGYAKKEEQ